MEPDSLRGSPHQCVVNRASKMPWNSPAANRERQCNEGSRPKAKRNHSLNQDKLTLVRSPSLTLPSTSSGAALRRRSKLILKPLDVTRRTLHTSFYHTTNDRTAQKLATFALNRDSGSTLRFDLEQMNCGEKQFKTLRSNSGNVRPYGLR